MRLPNRHALPLSILIMAIFTSDLLAIPPLQLFVDLTPAGETLRPLPGVYAGPIVINKPIILDGMNEVTIDGRGAGTILTIRAAGTEVRNLHLTGSGTSHDKVDAGVLIETDEVLLEHNIIDDVLFGVHISQGDGNTVRHNTISSRTAELTLRGEGIRLWYSRENLIMDNDITRVRDLVLTNSPYNHIVGNRISDSRIGLELIFSPGVEIAENILSRNENGIVGIYSDELHIHHNRIEHQSVLLGSAIAVKGSSLTRIEKNEILHCAIGLTANSPTHPENILNLFENRFAYNDVALYFYGDKGGHIIHGNRFVGNFRQVAVTGPTSALTNDWLGNYWQDYKGFDKDGDGTGDTPYSAYLYSDRIWMDRKMAKFFRGSPALELIDFAERLAPFSEPHMIFQDPHPRMY
ncbi:MAG: nitrous oxide reductase family maturation protein NosD [bacterium]|nr:nitrous oxide reductase family maturation protein NosD [bacterium]